MTDDHQLLRSFSENGSEDAFASLVQRHLGLVYHAALRRVGGDRHRAEDVSQLVFTDLARKANQLSEQTSVAGWLYTSTRYAVSQILRSEQRRAARERITISDAIESASKPEVDWDELKPLIDEAMEAVGNPDRELILERFFEAKTFAVIGQRLSLSEDAVRMRTNRALEKLRDWFARKGIASMTSALGAALLAQSSIGAPIEFSAAVTAAALAKMTAAPLVAATLLFGMKKLTLGILGAVLIAGVTTIALQEHRNRELTALLQQKTDELKNSIAGGSQSAGPLAQAAEIEALRNRLAPLEKTRAAATSPTSTVSLGAKKATLAAGLVPIEKLAGAGLGTPRAAFATQLWAAHGGDIDLESKSITLGPKARERLVDLASELPENLRAQYSTPERLMAYLLAGSPHPVGGMEIMSEAPQDANNVTLNVRWQHEDSEQVNTNDVHMIKTGDQWQMLVSLRLVERAATLLSSH